MVFVKNCTFGYSFFLVKICQTKLFGVVLHIEIGFLDHKTSIKKVPKFAFFQRG